MEKLGSKKRPVIVRVQSEKRAEKLSSFCKKTRLTLY